MLHKILSVISLLAVIWIAPQVVVWAGKNELFGVFISATVTGVGAAAAAIAWVVDSWA